MKPYFASLCIGLLVGMIYSLFNVRSPAPPVIALVGLFGILLGEQAIPLIKKVVTDEGVTLSWAVDHFRAHSFGHLPTQTSPKTATVLKESKQ